MSWAERWAETLVESARQFGATLGAFVPSLLGTLLLLLLGYVLSRVFAKLVRALVARTGFDKGAERIGVTGTLFRLGFDGLPSALVGRLAFWFLMLTFLVSAADALGLATLSGTLDSFATYVPNVIAAVLIGIGGLLLAGAVRDHVERAADRLGFDRSALVGTVTHYLLILIVASVAIAQLDIDVTLVNRVLLAVIGAVGLALAITVGLGARDVARNLVTGTYARDLVEPGETVSIDGISGELEEVGAISTQLRTPDGGSVLIPNGAFLTSPVHRFPSAGSSGPSA